MGGTSLIELTVATFVLSLLLVVVFLLFGMGSRGFQAINQRQDAQSQISSIRAALQSDLQQTHFYGIFAREALPLTIGTENIIRDGLSCVSLDSWKNSSNFSISGLPRWNRWVIYRVTHEQSGQLIRHSLVPNPVETGLSLLKEPPFLATGINDSKPSRTSWSDVESTQNIAQNIKDFQVKFDQNARAIAVKVTIKKDSPKANAKAEELAANFYIQPHNTGPGD